MLPLFADSPRRRTPVVVITIIVVCVIVLLAEINQPDQRALEGFVRRWGLVPARLRLSSDPAVWLTLFSSMFLHGGWVHLIGNCWFLWLFGAKVEDRLGMARFIVFYASCGVGAAALQVAVDPGSAVPMVGASGAISGVLAACLRYFPTMPVYTLVPLWFAPLIPVPAFVFIAIWFAVQFWQGIGSISSAGMTAGVAWWAHVGGFVAGFWLAGVMRSSPGRSGR